MGDDLTGWLIMVTTMCVCEHVWLHAIYSFVDVVDECMCMRECAGRTGLQVRMRAGQPSPKRACAPGNMHTLRQAPH